MGLGCLACRVGMHDDCDSPKEVAGEGLVCCGREVLCLVPDDGHKPWCEAGMGVAARHPERGCTCDTPPERA